MPGKVISAITGPTHCNPSIFAPGIVNNNKETLDELKAIKQKNEEISKTKKRVDIPSVVAGHKRSVPRSTIRFFVPVDSVNCTFSFGVRSTNCRLLNRESAVNRICFIYRSFLKSMDCMIENCKL